MNREAPLNATKDAVPTEAIVRCGELSINVATSGQGPPMVLLHGVVRRWQDFESLIRPLSERWRLHAIDHRGHGRSSRAAGYRVIDYVQDVVAFMQTHVREPAVVLGHSLGAMVATAVAARVPELIKAAILEDPPFETMGVSIHDTPLPPVFQGMQTALTQTDRSVEAMASHLAAAPVLTPDMSRTVPLGELRPIESLRFTARCLADMDPAVLEPIIAGQWLDGYDVESTFKGVRCPTLLMQADMTCGGMLTDGCARQARELIRRCEHVRVDGIGHHIHGVDPAGMLRTVQAFLAGA